MGKIVLQLACLIICIFPTLAETAELAVIPYLVQNSSKTFPATTGTVYAQYIGLAAHLAKGFDIYNPQQLKRDLLQVGIHEHSVIGKDDLALLCKTRYLNYVVSGRIMKTSKGYKAESLLYARGAHDIIARSSVRASTLEELVEQDMQELLSFYFNQETETRHARIDAAVLLDSSYNLTQEWNDVQEGVERYAEKIFTTWPGSKVYLLPYTDRERVYSAHAYTSIAALKRSLKNIRLKGHNSGKSFQTVISTALENIPWQQDAAKMMVICTNSPYGDNLYNERFALKARKKGIKIYTIQCANVSPEDGRHYSRFAKISRGISYGVSYHQTLYDKQGHDFHLYMQNRRLFVSDKKAHTWQEGILQYGDNAHFGYAQPPSFARELEYTPSEYAVKPYNMQEYYKRKGERAVLNAHEVENNIAYLLADLPSSYAAQSRQVAAAQPVARALLSEGKISLWVDIVHERDLRYFIKQKQEGHRFFLGVHVMPDSQAAYGITFNAQKFITGMTDDYLPRDIIVSLKNIVSNADYYVENGLLKPPIWFINVRIEKVRLLRKKEDIRTTR